MKNTIKKYCLWGSLIILILLYASCLKYNKLNNIKGASADINTAAPLFSYTLTIQDVFSKINKYDTTFLKVDANKVYYWEQLIPKGEDINIDSLYKNIAVDPMIIATNINVGDIDRTSSDYNHLAGILLGDLTNPNKNYFYSFPIINSSTNFDLSNGKSLNQIDNIYGINTFKIENPYPCPITLTFESPYLVDNNGNPFSKKITLSYKEVGTSRVYYNDTIVDFDLSNYKWTCPPLQSNTLYYNITTELQGNTNTFNIISSDFTYFLNYFANPAKKINIYDTIKVNKYFNIYGNLGKNTRIVTDSFYLPLNIYKNPFTNRDNTFANIGLEIYFYTQNIGLFAAGKMYDAYIKMKDGSNIPIQFYNKGNPNIAEDTFRDITIQPATHNNIQPFAIQPGITHISLDTSNFILKGNVNPDLIAAIGFKLDAITPPTTSNIGPFALQSTTSTKDSVVAKIILPFYIRTGGIFTNDSLIKLPVHFFTNIDSIINIKNRGSLKEVDFKVIVDNFTSLDAALQLYFIKDNTIIDSFVDNPPAIAAAGEISIAGIIRLHDTTELHMRINPERWNKLKQANNINTKIKFTSKYYEKTNPKIYPAISNNMYIKMLLNAENVNIIYYLQ